MSVDRERLQVPGRVLVAAGVLTAALLATLVGGDLRERAVLPDAARELRAAVAASASLVSCFEGVQDDLGIDPDGPTPLALDAAAARLETCDPDDVLSRVDAIRLPPPAPVTDTFHREIRTDLQDAVGALERTVLDAHTTRRAMEQALRDGVAGSPEFAIGFRATNAGYEAARGRLTVIEAAMDRLTSAGPG